MGQYSVSGKVALVTGAAKGIGWETARLLHARGAAVALVDLDLEETERAAASIGPDRTLAFTADVTDREAVESAVAATVERFGGLDVPVANAGIAPQPRTMRSGDPELFRRVLDINLNGVCNTVDAALPHVIERRGQIVVIASVYAFLNGVMATPYAMSKAAVEQLGRALRLELAPHGASATVGYFGFVDTKMVRDAFIDPLAQQMYDTLPSFVSRRITPGAAGAALVRGIERRAPRVIAPRWWAVYSVLRGVVNPLLDARMERDDEVLRVVREADRDTSAEQQALPQRPAG
jgi:NAD(P)-dependent dehydrogenase (short-subunit alcohol dehydrogenase family)